MVIDLGAKVKAKQEMVIQTAVENTKSEWKQSAPSFMREWTITPAWECNVHVCAAWALMELRTFLNKSGADRQLSRQRALHMIAVGTSLDGRNDFREIVRYLHNMPRRPPTVFDDADLD